MRTDSKSRSADRTPSREKPRTEKGGAEAAGDRWQAVGRVARSVIFGLALFAVLVTGRPPLPVEPGQRSPTDFRARASFTSTDIEATREAREEARRGSPPVFRLTADRWTASVQRLQAAVREADVDPFRPLALPRSDRRVLRELLPALQRHDDALEDALERLSELPVVSPQDLRNSLVQEKTTGRVVLVDADEQEQKAPLESLVPLSAESPQFQRGLGPLLSELDVEEADSGVGALTAVLEPRFTLDLERSREAAERAAGQVPTVTKFVEKGSILLARGSEVRRQHMVDLRKEREAYLSTWNGLMVTFRRMAGVGVLLFIVLFAGFVSCRRYRPALLDEKSQMLAFAALSLVLVGTARVCFAQGLSPLWVPVPMMVMAMCLVYDQFFGLGVAVFYALLVRLASPGADMELVVLLLGGMTAALLTGQVRTRSSLIRAGVLTGLAQFLAVWGLGLMSVDGGELAWPFWTSALAGTSLIALANGLSSGFVVSGLLPALERVFGITTDIRLLEWSDPNQPLLQRMLVDAPGTYHHSMIVGGLAADAAEAIGANPLLARVSAYFHDVGKLKKPEYFVENLPEGASNPHDELSPTMSTLIITAHPKDGAEMAEEYGVPKPVRDVILQSHGTSVLKYFYEKAHEEGELEHSEVRERNFRYRLTKPQRKEAAIVMLCDAAESAARSMQSPSAGQVGNLVHQIVNERLQDGQLDESGLTIPDLKNLQDALTHGLIAVFHNRVRYPGQEELEAGQAGLPTEQTPVRETAADATGD